MFSYFLFRSLLLCFLFERSENYADVAIALLYGVSRAARNGHVALQGHSLIDADLLYIESVLVELEVVGGIGNGGINEIRQWVTSLLHGLGQYGLGIAYALAADHVSYDADLAGRDAVIFERCGDHDSRLFFGAAFGGGGFGS